MTRSDCSCNLMNMYMSTEARYKDTSKDTGMCCAAKPLEDQREGQPVVLVMTFFVDDMQDQNSIFPQNVLSNESC